MMRSDEFESRRKEVCKVACDVVIRLVLPGDDYPCLELARTDRVDEVSAELPLVALDGSNIERLTDIRIVRSAVLRRVAAAGGAAG